MAALQSMTEGHPPKPPSRSFQDILTGQSSSNFQLHPSTLYKGFPSVAFSDAEITRFSAPFRYALIGKFSYGRPPMESIRKAFVSIGFAGTYTLGLIDRRHILINFQKEEDYIRSFLKRIYSIDGFIMRIFKWSPQFSVDSEPAILPIWISFPLLPLHFFHKEALYNIARLIGDPLKLDASTTAFSRPSVARVCVELNLWKPRPEKVWIVNGDDGFWQPVEYEKIPPLCSHCHKIGHLQAVCRDACLTPPAVADPLKKTLPPKGRLEYRPKGVQGQLGIAAVLGIDDSAKHGLDGLLAEMMPDSALNQSANTDDAQQRSADQGKRAIAADVDVSVLKISTPTEPKAKAISISEGSLAADTGIGSALTHSATTAVVPQGNADHVLGSEPSDCHVPCNSVLGEFATDFTSNSNEAMGFSISDEVCLLASTFTVDNLASLPLDLIAISHANEAIPSPSKKCHSDFAELHRTDFLVQEYALTFDNTESLARKNVVSACDQNLLSNSVDIIPRCGDAPLPKEYVAPVLDSSSLEAVSQAAVIVIEKDQSEAAAESIETVIAPTIPVSALVPLRRQPNDAQDEVPIPKSDASVMPISSPKQPSSRADLDDLFKNFEDSPFPSIHRRSLLIAKAIAQPSKALIPAPEVMDIAPLAVLIPEATPDGISPDFEPEDRLCYNEDLEVRSSYFQPLAPGHGRGKNKPQALVPVDEVLETASLVPSDIEAEDLSAKDDTIGVESSSFNPIIPFRGRGKKKKIATQSDRVMRPRKISN